MLTQCDKEPIHLISKIKDEGYLLVIDTVNFNIIQISENFHTIFEDKSKKILNTHIQYLFGENYFQDFKKAITQSINNIDEKFQKFFSTFENKELYTIIHSYEHYYILEVVFSTKKAETMLQDIHEIQNVIRQYNLYETTEHIYQNIVAQTQKISGFDRVLLYKFDEQYNGQIIAQVAKTMHENFLGHHFPASDIPIQARALYLTNRFRTISNSSPKQSAIIPELNPLTNAPLDLSDSFLRSVSPIHLEYLKNMGVTASMSMSIIIDGKLWGMVVAHHPSSKAIPLFQYEFYLSLSYIFSQQIEQKILIQNYDQKQELAFQRKLFFHSLQAQGGKNFFTSLDILKKEFCDLIPCDELFVISGSNSFSAKNLISTQEIQLLIKDIHPHIKNNLYTSNTLLQEFPQFEDFSKKFAGIYLYKLQFDQEDIIFVFLRFEQTYVIKWAGEPNKEVEYKDGEIVLSPRASFESWKEEVKGTSIAFNFNELESLELFFKKLYSKALQMQKQQEAAKLKELNKKLQIQANTDPLTLLYNQRYCKEFGIMQFKKSQKTDECFSLILLDIKNFKNIKELYGNEMSDYVLMWVTSKLKQILPDENSVISRIGCEEFAVILYDISPQINKQISTTILEKLSKPNIHIEQSNIELSLTYGIAIFDKTLYRNFSEMVRAAELQLYLSHSSNEE